MKCMRCGNDTTGDSVFCDDCLADMERHPVKPGTPINLPRRDAQPAPKRSKKRTLRPEEQIHALRRLVIWLMALSILLSLALAACVYMLTTVDTTGDGGHLPGQNYGSSVDGV